MNTTHPPIRTFADIERELDLPAEDLLRTMAFTIEGQSGAVVLASLPMPAKLAYGRLANELGVSRARLRQAGPDELRVLGMEPGGVSPLTRVPNISVIFDVSVTDMKTVYCGSGRADRTIEVATDALIELVRPRIASVATS